MLNDDIVYARIVRSFDLAIDIDWGRRQGSHSLTKSPTISVFPEKIQLPNQTMVDEYLEVADGVPVGFPGFFMLKKVRTTNGKESMPLYYY